jgi:pimeloyl-ACP methyl ester carboxylesterase
MEPIIEGTGSNARRTGIPNFTKTSLTNHFQLISYNNYGISDVQYATLADSSQDVQRLANECFVFLQHLNIQRVHVFAHHQVGYVSLKLAVDHPDLVSTLAFLDFEIVKGFMLKPKVQQSMTRLMQKAQMDPMYQQRMEMLRQAMESGTLPDGTPVPPEMAAKLATIPKPFLGQSAPGADNSDPNSMLIRGWTENMLSTSYEDVASKFKKPIFNAVWESGEDWAVQSSDLLKGWLTQTEAYTIPKKAHWYSGQNDEGLAEGLIGFYSRHSF